MKNVELRLRYTPDGDFIACLYAANAPEENGVHAVHDMKEYRWISQDVMDGTTFNREIFVTHSRASAEELALLRRMDIMEKSSNLCEVTITEIDDNIHAVGILTNNPDDSGDEHVLPVITDLRESGDDLTFFMRGWSGPAVIPRTDRNVIPDVDPSAISREAMDDPLTLVEDQKWAEYIDVSDDNPFPGSNLNFNTSRHVLSAIKHLVSRYKRQGDSAPEDMIAKQIWETPTLAQKIFIADYVTEILDSGWGIWRGCSISAISDDNARELQKNSFFKYGDDLNSSGHVMVAIDKVATRAFENSIDVGNGPIDIDALSLRIHQTPTRDEFASVYDYVKHYDDPENIFWNGTSIQEMHDGVSEPYSAEPEMEMM